MFQILVVDDDRNTRLLLRAVLQAENYTVFTAENGEDALQVMDREHIDLVVLDYDSFTVSRGGETQELPQKEFLLLYKLLSYPGKIFTRIQLMDEIWGMDCETGWETVTVHIGRLRKRFEAWPEFEIISVRGLGYKAVKKV